MARPQCGQQMIQSGTVCTSHEDSEESLMRWAGYQGNYIAEQGLEESLARRSPVPLVMGEDPFLPHETALKGRKVDFISISYMLDPASQSCFISPHDFCFEDILDIQNAGKKGLYYS